jgi:uncharacterized protein (TIGR02453 family)
MRSPYFSSDSLLFLKELRRHNDREWFQRNKARYESQLRDPFLRLIADLAAPLKRINPYLVADPRPVGGSMMRIYRDIRFSADKSPYKAFVAAHFEHTKADNGSAPAYYLHFEPERSSIGAGLWRPEPDALCKIREAIVADAKRWQRVTSDAHFGSTCGMAGESLKRPPIGFDPNHPLINDIKRKDYAISFPLTDQQVCAPDLLDSTIGVLRAAAPFMQFLSEALGLP